VKYSVRKLPEPVLPPGLRVWLRHIDAEQFGATISGASKCEALAFKHLCIAHGGERASSIKPYIFSFRDLPDLVAALHAFETSVTPDPEIGAALVAAAQSLERRLGHLTRRCAKLPHPLYPYQQDGAEYLTTHPRALLADEMGLGKTVQVLAALPSSAAVLVVCPASMRLTWLKEGETWRPDITWRTALKTSGITNPDKGEGVICSPEGMTRAIAQLGGETITLVVDEAHYYKTTTAKRTQALAAIAKRCARVWALTGTPMTNRPPDLRGVLQAFGLFSRAWPTAKYFDVAFGVHFDQITGRIDWPAKAPYPDAIVRSLGRVAIRRARADVLPELPSKTYAEIHVDLRDSKVSLPKTTKEHQRIFRAVDKGGLELLKFEQFSGFSDARAALAEAKIPQMLEVVERFREQGAPLVICSCNTAPLQELRKRGFAVIMGDVPPEKRQAAVEAFQAGDEPVIGIQTVAGGTGITLTRAAHMLMVQRDWVPANNVQAEDRIARIGQTAQSVVIYDMLANHPLDEIISRNVRDKQNRIDMTVNRVTNEITSGRELVNKMRELAGYINE